MFVGDSNGISVEIMGKQHQFSCSAEQAEDLKLAANQLAAMCNDIKQQAGSGNNERALLVASINLSYSLLMANNNIESSHQRQNTLITALTAAL